MTTAMCTDCQALWSRHEGTRLYTNKPLNKAKNPRDAPRARRTGPCSWRSSAPAAAPGRRPQTAAPPPRRPPGRRWQSPDKTGLKRFKMVKSFSGHWHLGRCLGWASVCGGVSQHISDDKMQYLDKSHKLAEAHLVRTVEEGQQPPLLHHLQDTLQQRQRGNCSSRTKKPEC